MSEFLKLKPAAEQLGLPYYWLREQAVSGEIPAFRTGGNKGTWMVNIEKVKEAILNMPRV
ncbi:MAG: hypothetical protein FWD70_05470 [Desulfuromonadales bacterium]|nr:hypothetical protein [Desulfuromonadales bacterium]